MHRRFSLQLVIVLMWSSTLLFARSPPNEPPSPSPRVKSTQPATLRMLREGYERSATFRSLVDRINQSNAIVLVQQGRCAGGHVRSCLVAVVGTPEKRFLKIKVDPHTTTLRLMGAIGHELQHAVEIIEAPDVIDGKSARALFRRIGTESCRSEWIPGCETELALDTESRVLRELHESLGAKKNRRASEVR